MYTVLIVDDEPAAISLEKRMIYKTSKEFSVIDTAYNVDTALELYKKKHPDAILTDMKMPNKTGVDLIRAVNELDDGNTVCVSISGYSDFNYVHDAFANGAFDYLLKPVEQDKVRELFEKIRMLLEERKNVNLHIPLVGKYSDLEMVNQIEQYIRSHLGETNSILTICNVFGINQPYLSRIFRSERGSTYNEVLTNIRIKEAKRLLLTGRYQIGQIAEFVGYNSQFYFIRVFKNVTGCTPKEFSTRSMPL